MEKKKRYLLNCEVCDARKMHENLFDPYDEVVINADVLLVNEDARRNLSRYPIQLNVDNIVEAEGDVDVQVQNGWMELKCGQMPARKTVLVVNGELAIWPGTEELLKNYLAIIVNGSVRYPESLSAGLTRMKVNGKTSVYPDDCIILKGSAKIDAYFPLRAEAGARYYAERRVVLLDEKLDVAALAEKQVRFETQELLVTESNVEAAVPLVGAATTLTVVPDGCAYVDEVDGVSLDERLLRKYGKKLYINGDLSLDANSTPYLAQIEYLYVNGTVLLLPEQKDAFLTLNVDYKMMIVRSGLQIANRLKAFVGPDLLDETPLGIMIQDCVQVILEDDLTAGQIQEKLKFKDCMEIICSEAQKQAVQMVSENVARINTDPGKGSKEEEDAFDGVRINAESYVL